MNKSKELIRMALAGESVPRTPIGPLAVHYCAGLGGVTIKRYTLEPRVMADCILRYYEAFRPDALWLSADTWVTAQAMGAVVGFTDDNQPMGGWGDPNIRSASDIDALPPPDPGSQGRFPVMLEALRLIKRAVGDDVQLVACFDQYPFSLACALMGISNVMINVIEDPAAIKAMMERCVEYTTAYAKALVEAGADQLSGGDSPAGLVGDEHFEATILPYEKRLIANVQAATGKPVSLHICGNSRHVLAHMATSGADILEVDFAVDPTEACRIIGPDIALWGNLDPVRVLAQGSEEKVRKETRYLLESVHAAGHRRFVLSSGCTLAVETPLKNIRAMIDECRNFDREVLYRQGIGKRKLKISVDTTDQRSL